LGLVGLADARIAEYVRLGGLGGAIEEAIGFWKEVEVDRARGTSTFMITHFEMLSRAHRLLGPGLDNISPSEICAQVMVRGSFKLIPLPKVASLQGLRYGGWE